MGTRISDADVINVIKLLERNQFASIREQLEIAKGADKQFERFYYDRCVDLLDKLELDLPVWVEIDNLFDGWLNGDWFNCCLVCLYLLGRDDCQSRKFLRRCDQYISKHPRSGCVYIIRGKYYLRYDENSKMARKDFDRALICDPALATEISSLPSSEEIGVEVLSKVESERSVEIASLDDIVGQTAVDGNEKIEGHERRIEELEEQVERLSRKISRLSKRVQERLERIDEDDDEDEYDDGDDEEDDNDENDDEGNDYY